MSGKSTMSLLAIANVQKTGGPAVLLDMEHSFDPVHAATLGVDVKNLRVNQPDYGEQALEAVNVLCKNNAVDIIVLDSTAAMLPKAEFEGDMDRKGMGEQARMLSQGLRKLVGVIGKSNTVVIFINQLREQIGQMFGDPNITPGGKALKFYASVRLDVRRMSGKDNIYRNEAGDVIGNRVKVKVVKNKCAIPFKECEFDLYYDKGVDAVSEIPALAISRGLVDISGNTYTYGEQKWVGLDKFSNAIRGDEKLRSALYAKLTNVDKKAKAN
jgi:recombination protein RecA